jgi:hypothetical protein
MELSLYCLVLERFFDQKIALKSPTQWPPQKGTGKN